MDFHHNGSSIDINVPYHHSGGGGGGGRATSVFEQGQEEPRHTIRLMGVEIQPWNHINDQVSNYLPCPPPIAPFPQTMLDTDILSSNNNTGQPQHEQVNDNICHHCGGYICPHCHGSAYYDYDDDDVGDQPQEEQVNDDICPHCGGNMYYYDGGDRVELDGQQQEEQVNVCHHCGGDICPYCGGSMYYDDDDSGNCMELNGQPQKEQVNDNNCLYCGGSMYYDDDGGGGDCVELDLIHRIDDFRL